MDLELSASDPSLAIHVAQLAIQPNLLRSGHSDSASWVHGCVALHLGVALVVAQVQGIPPADVRSVSAPFLSLLLLSGLDW
jgi:hypothetical protein